MLISASISHFQFFFVWEVGPGVAMVMCCFGSRPLLPFEWVSFDTCADMRQQCSDGDVDQMRCFGNRPLLQWL